MSLRNFLALGIAVGSGVLITFAEQAHHRQLELKTKDASLSDPTNDGQLNKTMTDTSATPDID
ncbi:hypothetical protein BN1708_002323 [Verticillium longisporum]|uniref:Uncharacterized protein n=1 Tax=Verticillium longisporum TaxID=100787 RepID=A0A0G4KQ33_VERLO|nr:hypothetical protein BN1708_002323 [Verticillium longisporum]